MRLQFSIGLTSNPRTWPIIDERIKPDSIDFVPTVLHPSELFWRQLRFAEFDVAEMSMSSLMMAKSKGDERFVGIPVFTTRLFFHTTTLVRRGANIDSPADLKGKRVGVPEYQQTAALWARGVMQHEFGVAPKEMEFWMERPPSRSHGGATGFVPPPGVTVRQIPPEKNIGAMMLSGELDAVMYYLVDPNLIDRSTADLRNHPDIKPLFPDPSAEGVRYFQKTGLYPINHGMVIKRELAEQHPWALTNILKAFNRANELANRQRMEHVEYHLETGLLPAQARKALATPILSHAISANRHVLETIAEYSVEQGLTPRLMKLDELFGASVMAQ
jgi:4,5-dihydroxyphthalate decarboxylase